MKLYFSPVRKQFRIYCNLTFIILAGGFFKDIADSLETCGEWSEILRVTDCLYRRYAIGSVAKVVRPRGEYGIDFVVRKPALFAEIEARALQKECGCLRFRFDGKVNAWRIFLQCLGSRGDHRRNGDRQAALQNNFYNSHGCAAKSKRIA